MPTYIYFCPECSKEKKLKHGINDEPVVKCTNCDYSPMEIKIQPTAYMFKGKGWAGRRDWQNHLD